MPTIGFRLAVRDETDSFDEYIITSVPGTDTPTTHPVLTEPPTVDGASADLIEGTVDVGSGTIRFWDELTTVTLPGDVFVEPFNQPDVAAVDAVWPVSGGLPSGTATWSIAGGVLTLDLVGYGGGAGQLRRAHAVGGLTLSRTYTLTGRVRVTGTLPGDAVVRISVSGGTGDVYATVPASGAWETVSASRDPGTSGDLELALWVSSDFGGAITATVEVDDLRLSGPNAVSTTGRVMTARLYDVQDAVARLTQLSRRCRIDQTTDGGETWTAYHRGYLNRLEVTGGEWTVTVGDTTRREQQAELFATLPTLDPADVGLPMPMPRVGLIWGGPIASDATYGKFAGIEDFGPTRWKVETVYTDPEGEFRTVRFKFLHGYLRPYYDKDRTKFEQEEWEKTNNVARPFFQWDPERFQSEPSATVNHFGDFPTLVAQFVPAGGGAALEKMPLARLTTHEPGDKTKPKAEFDAVVGNDSVFYVDWTNDASAAPFPAVNAEFDVVLFSRVISDTNPLHVAGHPVDVVAYAASLSGVSWSEASRVSCKAAIGDGLWFEGPLTTMKFADLQRQFGGSFGFLFRPNAETDEREFVPTRVRPEEPQFTITDADLVDASDGGEGDQPTAFDADEDSVINVVKFATKRLRRFRWKDPDEGDPPLNMLAVAKAEVEGARDTASTLSAHGERTHTFEIPGQVGVRATDGTVAPLILATFDDANPGYAEAAGGVLIDYAGWGVPTTTRLVDAESPAAAAQLGDEGTVDGGDLPVPDAAELPITARGVDRTHAPRVVRVVKRDPQIGAVQFTLAHLGELSQDAVAAPETGGTTDAGTPEAPTLSLAASASAPMTVVTVTLTNGAALGADNLRTELEYLVQPATPAGTDEGTEFGPVTAYPDGDAQAIDTPSVAPGSVVWVRARSVNATSGVASAWTTWDDVSLAPVENGGTTPAERPYAPARPTFTHAIDGSGVVTVTANAPGAASVKLAGSTSAAPDAATVRATTADAAAPFTFAAVFTLTLGQTGYVSAFAYDATGNESAMATAPITWASAGDVTQAEFDALAADVTAHGLVLDDHEDRIADLEAAGPGGGGGGNGAFNPEQAEASPSAGDDDFASGSTMDLAKWTAFDLSTLTHALRGGKIVVSGAPPASSTNKVRGWLQALPAGDFTALLGEAAVFPAESGARVGIILTAGTTSSSATFIHGLVVDTTVKNYRQYSTTSNVITSTAITVEGGGGSDFRLYGPHTGRVRVRRVGTTWCFGLSVDGRVWDERSMTALPITPTHIGVGLTQSDSTRVAFSAGPWRIKSGDGDYHFGGF